MTDVGYSVLEWDDPRGDVGWVVVDRQGRVVSKHMTYLSAVAAVARRAVEEGRTIPTIEDFQ